jgi:hypothetical protein
MNADIQAAFDFAMQHKWAALTALLIGALVRLMKEDVTSFPINVPKRWRPTTVVMLGIGSGVLERAAHGIPWSQAALGGLGAAGVAMMGHGVLIEGLRAGKEVPMELPKKTPSVPPPPVAVPEPEDEDSKPPTQPEGKS